VVLRDVRPRGLLVAIDILYKAAVCIFREEGASMFLETMYSTYRDTELHGVITSYEIITFISLFHT